jgi:hypothetical protein
MVRMVITDIFPMLNVEVWISNIITTHCFAPPPHTPKKLKIVLLLKFSSTATHACLLYSLIAYFKYQKIA